MTVESMNETVGKSVTLVVSRQALEILKRIN
jgi:hypothetical protein